MAPLRGDWPHDRCRNRDPVTPAGRQAAAHAAFAMAALDGDDPCRLATAMAGGIHQAGAACGRSFAAHQGGAARRGRSHRSQVDRHGPSPLDHAGRLSPRHRARRDAPQSGGQRGWRTRRCGSAIRANAIGRARGAASRERTTEARATRRLGEATARAASRLTARPSIAISTAVNSGSFWPGFLRMVLEHLHRPESVLDSFGCVANARGHATFGGSRIHPHR
jgi:hypothetical protein